MPDLRRTTGPTLLLAVAALSTAAADRRMAPESAADSLLVRAWLRENLDLDRVAADSLYRTLEQLPDRSRPDVELALARRFDLEGSAPSTGADLGSGAFPPDVREALDALGDVGQADLSTRVASARGLADPKARAEALDAIRREVLEEERREDRPRDPRRPAARSAFELVYERSFGSPARRPERPGSLGLRRDWAEFVDLLLGGRFEDADQTAWLRFGMRPRVIDSAEVDRFVNQQLDRLRRMTDSGPDRTPLGARERSALQRLSTAVRERIDAGDREGAVEILRRLPFPPR